MASEGPEHHLWGVFEAVADAVPDRAAIVQGPLRRSYAQVHERADRFASALASWGLGCHVPRARLQPWESGQDTIALYLLNGPEYLESSLGAYGARVLPANVNYRYTSTELAYLLTDAAPAVIVYHLRFGPVLAEAIATMPGQPRLVHVVDGSGSLPLPGSNDFEAVLAGAEFPRGVPVGGPPEPDDLYLLYTGGTTGMPKGTLWRQADVFAAALSTPALGLSITDIVQATTERGGAAAMPLAPLMHGAAHWAALAALLAGDTVVLNSIVDRLDPVDVWTSVERERVSRLMMVGEAFARPLIDELAAGTYDASSIELVVLGGAATSPETKQRLLELLPGAHLADVAGASETGSLLSAVSAKGRITDAGVFRPGPTTVVLDEERAARLEAGHDGIGWVAKSGNIPLGYLGDEAKTQATFVSLDDVRYTVPGDRASLRADGMVTLHGRDSVTINSAGEKIFAEEVEAALLRVPEVVDAIVCGRPSERWGQEVVAVVAYRPGQELSLPDLVANVEGLARYKLPKDQYIVDTVLRSPSGKADYAWARQLIQGEPTHGR